ncbi:MAG TPA: hypothetical protein VFT22_02580 [Kofleriaceae bacterium]|nr:hypothetical protein [Kofleriaceae bacterium]
MTARGSGPQLDGPGESPPSESERAESDWLLAREHDPSTPAPSAALAREYAEIEAMLAALPPGLPDDHWKADVLRAAAELEQRRERRPLPWWRRAAFRWALGAGLAAAAAALILVWGMRPPAAPGSELVVIRESLQGVRGGSGEAAVGERVIITAHSREPAELYVYRPGGVLMARCPSGPRCARGAPDDFQIELTLDAPGTYLAVLFAGVRAPLPDSLDDATMAAIRMGARVADSQEIPVR